MRALLLAGVVAVGWMSPATASVTTYNVSGTFADGRVLGGSFTVDNTAASTSDEFKSTDLTVTGLPDFTEGVDLLTEYGPSPTRYRIQFATNAGSLAPALLLAFYADQDDGLLGSIPNQDLITDPPFITEVITSSSSDGVALAAGTIAAATTVPEPSTLALLSLPLGLAGLIVVERRKIV